MIEIIDTDLETIFEVENIILLGEDIINDLDLVISMLFNSNNSLKAYDIEFISEKLEELKLNLYKFEELLFEASSYMSGFTFSDEKDLKINNIYENLEFMNNTQVKFLAFNLENVKLNLVSINNGLTYYNKKLMKNSNFIN